MPRPPRFSIEPAAFFNDPYPDLARMRADAPIAYVPELDAILITRHKDIFRQEKRIATFSSLQPDGLMTKLMGENMMRKDGADHITERKATYDAFSPKTVAAEWAAGFQKAADRLLDDLVPKGRCDLMRDYALPLTGEGLRLITGLSNVTAVEIDQTSQAMIDGVANYAGLPEVEARCHVATAKLDAAIEARQVELRAAPDLSLIGVQMRAGLSPETIRANVKLAISGGQNETRDAIAGTAWAVLVNPDSLDQVRKGQRTWRDAFEEFARWISPIGMSPRRVAQADQVSGVDLLPDDRVFFMFGSGNRDDRVFEAPDQFQIARDTRKSLAFGAGPHMCAGAAASRSLIADVALPSLFARCPDLALDGDVTFAGWAFRGPISVPVRWST